MKYPIFAVLAAVTVAGAPACTPPPAELEKGDAPGIVNFSRIDGERGFGGSPVGFGGATQPAAMPWLKSEGFAAVINLRLATEEGADVDGSRAAAQEAGLNYIHLPFSPGNPDPDVVDDFLIAVGDRVNQPVYIHCGSATRAAALWMIGRVLEDGWDIDTASEEAKLIAAKPADAVAVATQYLTAQAQ